MLSTLPGPVPGSTIKVAAAGDIHCHEGNRDEIGEAFERIAERADLVALAGDLTTHGEPEQAAVLADACRELDVPVFTVLGNHDWHANRVDELLNVLESGGIRVIDRRSARCKVRGVEIGLAGAKGFVGGFPDSTLPDFGEPLMRAVYAETGSEVRALDVALEEIADCRIRIALLHYSPTTTTLAGERQTIWSFLGSDRLAEPISRHAPTVVLHGHGHGGTFEGFIGPVPVFNVAVHVMDADFWVFEFDEEGRLLHKRSEPEPALRAAQHAET
jgi:Icc-related predicted phosphoesterase